MYKDVFYGEMKLKVPSTEADKVTELFMEVFKGNIFNHELIYDSEVGECTMEGLIAKAKKHGSTTVFSIYGNVGSIYYEKYFKQLIRLLKANDLRFEYIPDYKMIASFHIPFTSLENEELIEEYIQS